MINTPTRQYIGLHYGQTGTHLADPIWTALAATTLTTSSNQHQNGAPPLTSTPAPTHPSAFFAETDGGRHFVPRAVLIDGPDVTHYHAQQKREGGILSRARVHASNECGIFYTRGHYTICRDLREEVLESVRKLVEGCDNFGGFFTTRSMGGGTGSGFGSFFDSLIFGEYGMAVTNANFAFLPCGLERNTVSIYNTILALCDAICTSGDQTSWFLFDNSALYSVLRYRTGLVTPSFVDVNRTASVAIASILASEKFNEIIVNSTPFPNTNFLCESFAPLHRPQHSTTRENPETACTTSKSMSATTREYLEGIVEHNPIGPLDLLSYAMEPESQMLSYHSNMGKYLSCCALYRGAVNEIQAVSALSAYKQSHSSEFVNFNPCNFKAFVSNCPSLQSSLHFDPSASSVCVVSNNSAISNVLSEICSLFDTAYAKRAFVHWFSGEGLSEGYFEEARERIEEKTRVYEEFGREPVETDDEDE
ncbi:Tubulin alpha-2 chain [Pelomyxa schiedti]|nr:Tubulin alpha-2 chain [Pelomyxa schiedti]